MAETLVKRYGLNFGNGEADRTSEEERRILSRRPSAVTLAPAGQPKGAALPVPAVAIAVAPLAPFAELDAHLLGALQCIAKGRDAIEAMGPPDPVNDLPRLLRDKQMLSKALADFNAFQAAYARCASAVWNYINEACAHAPQLVELNAWLRRHPRIGVEFVHPYRAPPTGPTALNVVTGKPLWSGDSYTAITFEGKGVRVWATHNEADHLLLLHGLYHFWRYAEKAVEIQIGLDRDMERAPESFYVMWQRWMGTTQLNMYASSSLFGKNVVHLRRILNSVLSVLSLVPEAPEAASSAK